MQSTIGERLTYIREAITMSQEDIAPFLGMSRSNLSGIETGRISPTLYTICSICLLFDVYVDWLVLGTDDMPDLQRSSYVFGDWMNHRSTFSDPEPKTLINEDDVKEYIRIFAARLKIYRKTQGLKQKDVVNQTGVAQSSYTLIEKAKSNVSSEVLEKILRVLNLSGDNLIFGIKPYQKGIIFPVTAFHLNNNEEKIEKEYQKLLIQARNEKEPNTYVIREIQRTRLIPFNNLTGDQLQIIINLINEFEGKNKDEDSP